MPDDFIAYKRSRFHARLPKDRLYTKSHFWLLEDEGRPGVWRIGFTRFAVRMLGDLVEHDFEVAKGDAVEVGLTIGWLEGFKAASDLYCVADGVFLGGNPTLHEDITLVARDCFHRGWLYEVEGTPESDAIDIQGYMAFLDVSIDKIQGEHDAGLLDEDKEAAGDC